jgi:hypothetical protein
MKRTVSLGVGAMLVISAMACGGSNAPASPTSTGGTAGVRFVYRASTAPRTDLPPSARDCVQGVGRTHIHPSWRAFDRIDMNPIGGDRWESAFSDVPVGVRQSIRVSDGNACDQNATGAATQNVFANDVRLVEIVPTPGSGIEPGLAFTATADGRVTP